MAVRDKIIVNSKKRKYDEVADDISSFSCSISSIRSNDKLKR